MFKQLLTLALTVSAATTLVACSPTNTSKSADNSRKTSQLTANTQQVITRQTFDSLKVGALEANGQGGSNYNAIIQELGKPTKTDKSKVKGKTIEMATWEHRGGDLQTVMLAFGGDGNNRSLSSKSYVLKPSLISKHRITQAEYDKITVDGSMPFDDLLKQFGRPSTYTVVSIMDIETKTASWSNVAKDLKNPVTVTISGGNTIIGKSNSDK